MRQQRPVCRPPVTTGFGRLRNGLGPASAPGTALGNAGVFPKVRLHRLGQSRPLSAGPLRRRPRRPRPQVALTRSLRLVVWTCARDGNTGSVSGWRPRRSSEEESEHPPRRPGPRARGLIPEQPGDCPSASRPGRRNGSRPTRPELRARDGAAHPLPPSHRRPRPRTYPGGCGRAARPAALARQT